MLAHIVITFMKPVVIYVCMLVSSFCKLLELKCGFWSSLCEPYSTPFFVIYSIYFLDSDLICESQVIHIFKLNKHCHLVDCIFDQFRRLFTE
jgi:hypothetical protein